MLLCIPAGAQTPAEKETLTLEEAVRIALDRHPDVGKGAGRRRRAEGEDPGSSRSGAAQRLHVADAMRGRDPSFLNASGLDKFPAELRQALVPSPVNLFDYSVNVSQPLYTAGKWARP